MKFAHCLLAHLSAICLGIVIYFVQGPSFARHPCDRLADDGDSLLNAWILAWDAHALAEPNTNIWDAPIFYPAKNALTLSETMFGNLWITWPVQAFSGNFALTINALILSSFVLGLYTTCLLVWRLTGSYPAGIIAGILFSFNPVRWSEAAHVQLLPFFWAPLALLFAHRFLETARARYVVALLATLVAQYYTSIYLGTMLMLLISVFVIVHLLRERTGRDRWFWLTDRRLLCTILAGGLVAALALAPLALPYLRTTRQWDQVRSQAENISNSCEIFSFFLPRHTFRSYAWLADRFATRVRGEYGLGLAPGLLAMVGVVVFRRRQDEQGRLVRCCAWTALVMAIFMLGPCLVVLNEQRRIPLPYFLVYHLVPGAKAMRVPARFVFPLLLCVAIMGGFTTAHILRTWRSWRFPSRVAAAVAFIALFSLDYAVSEDPGFAIATRADFPPVYNYLAASAPDRPVLELPAGINGQYCNLYYQTAHWRPTLGGQSGSSTPAAHEMAKRLEGCPTERTLRFLELCPAQTIVIHLDRYQAGEREAWQNADLAPYGFWRAGTIGEAVVWERKSPLPSSAAKLQVVHPDLQFSRALLRDCLDVSLVLAPADKDLPWRYLERGLGELTIELLDTENTIQRLQLSFAIPPYLLSEDTTRVILDRVRGHFSEARRVRIYGPLIQKCEVNLDSGAMAGLRSRTQE